MDFVKHRWILDRIAIVGFVVLGAASCDRSPPSAPNNVPAPSASGSGEHATAGRAPTSLESTLATRLTPYAQAHVALYIGAPDKVFDCSTPGEPIKIVDMTGDRTALVAAVVRAAKEKQPNEDGMAAVLQRVVVTFDNGAGTKGATIEGCFPGSHSLAFSDSDPAHAVQYRIDRDALAALLKRHAIDTQL